MPITDVFAFVCAAGFTVVVLALSVLCVDIARSLREDRRRTREDEEVARLEALFDLDEVLAEQQVADLEALWRLPAAKRTA